MNPRILTFASLLLTSTAALADEPETTVPMMGHRAPAPTEGPLRARWFTQVRDGQVLVSLALVNPGTRPLDVLMLRGSTPGPWMNAQVGTTTLDRVLTELQQREFGSRMAPTSVFVPFPAGAQVTVATYRFTLPEDYSGQSLHLEVTVDYNDGGERLQQRLTFDTAASTS